MKTPATDNLLTIWGNRPRRRIDFENPGDQQFINSVLLAMKSAAHELPAVLSLVRPVAILGDPDATVSLTRATDPKPFSREYFEAQGKKEEEISKQLTTRSPAPAASATPSSAPQPAPETASSTHTQEATPSRVDILASFGQTAGSESTSASLPARLAEARAKAATAGRAKPSKPKSARKSAAAPPAAPQTTV